MAFIKYSDAELIGLIVNICDECGAEMEVIEDMLVCQCGHEKELIDEND